MPHKKENCTSRPRPKPVPTPRQGRHHRSRRPLYWRRRSLNSVNEKPQTVGKKKGSNKSYALAAGANRPTAAAKMTAAATSPPHSRAPSRSSSTGTVPPLPRYSAWKPRQTASQPPAGTSLQHKKENCTYVKPYSAQKNCPKTSTRSTSSEEATSLYIYLYGIRSMSSRVHLL